MEDGRIAQFISITSSTPHKAAQYLRIADGNIEQAIELFFVSDGADLEEPPSTSAAPSQAPPVPPPRSRPSGHGRPYEDTDGVIHVDSDEDISDDNDPEITGYYPRQTTRTDPTMSNAAQPVGQAGGGMGDDEAMARRLQEEMYAGADSSGGYNADGIRAPIAPMRETLVGPGSFDVNDQEEMRAAVLEQLRARQRPRPHGRPGIFNQQYTGSSNSIWEDEDADDEPSSRRSRLARSTAGASESSSKSTHLAALFRPPFEIMSRLSWEQARQEGREKEKWILVNIQDLAIFDCQVLNRDIWKDAGVKDTVQENFIFMQYSKDDPRGNQYVQYYFQARDNQDAYPHIAIVDPRTGEQVKVWSGPPAPKATDFLMQLHEFLDRYSLNAAAKNPVARRKPEPKIEKQVDKMTEDEMLEMALQNSLAGDTRLKGDDPDELTRSVDDVSKRMGVNDEEDVEMEGEGSAQANGHVESPTASLFSTILSTAPHVEPSPDVLSTRIQFRHPNGRVVRRFALSDPVRRIYEWLKSSPLEGKEGTEFELISMQKNLIGALDDSIDQAGLKNGTVMVEFLES